jgi:AcrR family transcriptional regulator
MGISKRETPGRILSAAADLFSRSAYAGVSVDNVAERAGCTKVTVYQHFESKDQLVIRCLRLRLDRREAQLDHFLERVRPGADPLMAVFDWLEQWLDPAEFRGCAFVKAVNELSTVLPEVREVAADAKERVVERFTALARRSGRLRPRELGQELALIFEGAQSLALIQASTQPAEVARRIAATILSTWQCRNTPDAKNNRA